MQLLRPLIEAVALAHESGVVHRDIKPANIMVLDPLGTGGVRVLDFGIAKMMNPDGPVSTGSTLTRSRTGFSPRYAAPEQIEGTRTGPWTDVHGLGLVLSEVLTGASPYGPGEFVVTVYARVASPKRPTPSAAGVDVGPWEPVLARALALKPNRRFGNARELLVALERSLAGQEWDRGPAEEPVVANAAPSAPGAVSISGRVTPAVDARRSRPSNPTQSNRLRDGALWLVAIGCIAVAGYLISR
jgi:serine/threonine-protein kinase